MLVKTVFLLPVPVPVPVPVTSSEYMTEGRDDFSVLLEPSLTDSDEFASSCSYSAYVQKLADFLCQFLPNFNLRRQK